MPGNTEIYTYIRLEKTWHIALNFHALCLHLDILDDGGCSKLLG